MSIDRVRDKIIEINNDYKIVDKAKAAIDNGKKNILESDEYTSDDSHLKKDNGIIINSIYLILTCIAITGIYGVMYTLVNGMSAILFLGSEVFTYNMILLLLGGLPLITLDVKQIIAKKINLFVYLIFIISANLFVFAGNFYVGALFRLFLGIILGAILYRIIYFIMLIVNFTKSNSNLINSIFSIIIKIFKSISNIFIGKSQASKKYQEKQIEDSKEQLIKSSCTADQIREFKLLLDDGIITQEEFDAKKSELLKR